MSHALRRLLLGAITSVPLLFGATYAYADDADQEDDTEEVEEVEEVEDDTTTITIEGGYADTDSSAVTIYTNELQPYGGWVTDPRWGTVWVPSSSVVGADFAPYQTSGHWEMTADDEWLWVSDYSWGYIPFHYGRWVWIDGTGWAWIPGRAYAPAWVVWRTGASGYIGWAPMPPAYYWMGGVYYTCSPPVAAYVFVSTTYVYERNVSTYIYRDRAEVTRAVDGTKQHQTSSPHYGPAQPAPKDAHVTPPATRGTSDPKAMALAKKPPGLGTSASAPKKKSAPSTKSTGAKSVDSAPSKTTTAPKTSKSSPTRATKTITPKSTSTQPVVVTPTSKPSTTTTRTTTTTTTPKVVSTPKVVTSTPRTTTTTTKPASKPSPTPSVTPSRPSTTTTTTPTPSVRKSAPSVRRGKR